MSCRKSRPTQEGLGSKIPETEAHAQGEAWMSGAGGCGLSRLTVANFTSAWRQSPAGTGHHPGTRETKGVAQGGGMPLLAANLSLAENKGARLIRDPRTVMMSLHEASIKRKTGGRLSHPKGWRGDESLCRCWVPPGGGPGRQGHGGGPGGLFVTVLRGGCVCWCPVRAQSDHTAIRVVAAGSGLDAGTEGCLSSAV